MQSALKMRKKIEPKNLSIINLAFIGDAIHTLFVRENVLKTASATKPINSLCSKLCSARYQALVLERLSLTDEEENIVRRARNFKTHNIAKNASLCEYKKATGFEALLGFLYLGGQNDRLKEILKESIKI